MYMQDFDMVCSANLDDVQVLANLHYKVIEAELHEHRCIMAYIDDRCSKWERDDATLVANKLREEWHNAIMALIISARVVAH